VNNGHSSNEARARGGPKLAYLVNQYPKVSHTFIRREISALESAGVAVERFSIRKSTDAVDDADRAEAEKTRVVLDAGAHRLAWSVLKTALKHPLRLGRAAALAARTGIGSERGLLVHGVYLAEACLLQHWLAESGCRHVHAHFGTNPATVAMLCRELGGPAFSFTVHGPEEFDKAATIALAEKIRRAEFVVAVSSFGRSQLLRHTRVEQWPKIHVVRCGVDDSFVRFEPDTPPSSPRLVCVGRLCEQKGQLLLVEAAAQLARRGVEFELMLVGDGEMRADIERRIEETGLAGRVQITGWLDGEGVRREIARARALILPSFAEGLPVVIMEALALGRPVVSTFVAGIPELVEPGQSGWLVPAGSVAELVASMEAALRATQSELAAMGEVGRARVLAHHDVRETARSLALLMPLEGT